MSEKLLRDLKTVRADFEAWRQRRRGRETHSGCLVGGGRRPARSLDVIRNKV